MPPAYDLNGKVALVTGAARGIGYETARQLHMRGASVALVDLDPEQARAAAEGIGPRAIGVGGDVTDRAAIEGAVAETVQRFGGIDVAVANAGIAQATVATVRGIDPEEWERVVEVDLLGIWRTVRAALPQVIERRGHVVLVASVFAFINGVLNSPYAVSKAGVEAFGRGLRAELNPLGASSSVAYFGWVETQMAQDSMARPHANRLLNDFPDWLVKRISPDEAGVAIVRGIEKRSPRIFAPKWWRYFSAIRGVFNPIVERNFDSNKNLIETVREIEAETDEQGAAAASAASR